MKTNELIESIAWLFLCLLFATAFLALGIGTVKRSPFESIAYFATSLAGIVPAYVIVEDLFHKLVKSLQK